MHYFVLAARDGPCEDFWGLGSIVVDGYRIAWAEFCFFAEAYEEG